jgi:hypothetical protein
MFKCETQQTGELPSTILAVRYSKRLGDRIFGFFAIERKLVDEYATMLGEF